MPPTKNNKPKTPTSQTIQPSDAAAVPDPQPEAGSDVALTPDRVALHRESDEELVLTFLTEYHALEQALVRAGFTGVGRTPGNAQPDWVRFARHIERYFDPDSSPQLQGAVAYMLGQTENWERRMDLLEDTFPWETASPHSDVVWLTELVQQARNRLAHGLNTPDRMDYNSTYVTAALYVVEAWAHIDPDVERWLVCMQ